MKNVENLPETTLILILRTLITIRTPCKFRFSVGVYAHDFVNGFF